MLERIRNRLLVGFNLKTAFLKILIAMASTGVIFLYPLPLRSCFLERQILAN